MPDGSAAITPESAICPHCAGQINANLLRRTLYGQRACHRCWQSFMRRRIWAYMIDMLLFRNTLVTLHKLIMSYLKPLVFIDSDHAFWASYLILSVLFIFKDGFRGYSPGKLLLGLRVVDVWTGQPASCMQSAKRNLPVLIPYAGALWIYSTLERDGPRLCDEWAGTVVIWNRFSAKLTAPYRAPDGRCHVCRYDLTGNVSGRCPECGTAIIQALAKPSATTPAD